MYLVGLDPVTIFGVINLRFVGRLVTLWGNNFYSEPYQDLYILFQLLLYFFYLLYKVFFSAQIPSVFKDNRGTLIDLESYFRAS